MKKSLHENARPRRSINKRKEKKGLRKSCRGEEIQIAAMVFRVGGRKQAAGRKRAEFSAKGPPYITYAQESGEGLKECPSTARKSEKKTQKGRKEVTSRVQVIQKSEKKKKGSMGKRRKRGKRLAVGQKGVQKGK